ncbi:hypothetical protein [Ferrovibrio terrae]|uniref:hypothetical protein n=1 Tax=Ferrovibrio terrae TaxID=2594003 RepID=UPI003137BF1F
MSLNTTKMAIGLLVLIWGFNAIIITKTAPPAWLMAPLFAVFFVVVLIQSFKVFKMVRKYIFNLSGLEKELQAEQTPANKLLILLVITSIAITFVLFAWRLKDAAN